MGRLRLDTVDVGEDLGFEEVTFLQRTDLGRHAFEPGVHRGRPAVQPVDEPVELAAGHRVAEFADEDRVHDPALPHAVHQLDVIGVLLVHRGPKRFRVLADQSHRNLVLGGVLEVEVVHRFRLPLLKVFHRRRSNSRQRNHHSR